MFILCKIVVRNYLWQFCLCTMNYFFGVWSLGMITGWGLGCTLSFGTWTEITKISFEYIYFYFLQIFQLTNFHFRLIWFFLFKDDFQPRVVTDWMIKINFPFTPFIFNMNERLSRFLQIFIMKMWWNKCALNCAEFIKKDVLIRLL